MEDRPDLIQSELTGMAFDSLQCVFRPADIEIMFTQEAPEPILNADIYLFIDPAAGGPQSDYAILSFQRIKGLVTVSDIYLGNKVQVCHHVDKFVQAVPLVAQPRVDHLLPQRQKEALCLSCIERLYAYLRQPVDHSLL